MDLIIAGFSKRFTKILVITSGPDFCEEINISRMAAPIKTLPNIGFFQSNPQPAIDNITNKFDGLTRNQNTFDNMKNIKSV